MARKKSETWGELEETTESTTPTPTFTIETFKKYCYSLFKVSTTVFTGATTGIEDKEYTQEEMRQIIEEWKGKVVK